MQLTGFKNLGEEEIHTILVCISSSGCNMTVGLIMPLCFIKLCKYVYGWSVLCALCVINVVYVCVYTFAAVALLLQEWEHLMIETKWKQRCDSTFVVNKEKNLNYDYEDDAN